MLKATFLEGLIELTITPDGPLLIKAGESGGADPTLPDMEFVRTRRAGVDQVYLPGPTLKGVIRAQCERICRSLDSEEQRRQRQQQRQQLAPDEPRIPLADNPLGKGTSYQGLQDMDYSSGRAIEKMELKGAERTAMVYRRSSFVSQIFGHTSLAGRVRFADAYSDEAQLEERNGVAIDRIYGSVAVGPFNYETLISGTFTTRINFRNLTLAQLGLLGLALRDLAEGRIAIGFGKSRGLGRVKVTFDALSIFYPTCLLEHGELRTLGGRAVAKANELAGLGALCTDTSYTAYALPTADTATLPEELTYTDDPIMGVRLRATGDTQVKAIWRTCMPAWKRALGL